NPLLRRFTPWLPASLRLDNFQLGARLSAQAQQIGIAVLAVATTFAAGVFNFLMDYFTMIIVLFFLLRDSDYFAASLRTISPLFCGGLPALLSLLPLVGTALVWVPWTICLFSAGSPVKAVIFLVLEVGVVGTIDNVLRPALIRGGVKMHTMVVFFSILGGISY